VYGANIYASGYSNEYTVIGIILCSVILVGWVLIITKNNDPGIDVSLSTHIKYIQYMISITVQLLVYAQFFGLILFNLIWRGNMVSCVELSPLTCLIGLCFMLISYCIILFITHLIKYCCDQ
jgi:hypothetical protein